MTYNAFIGGLTLTKFKADPHYAYLVLKITRPHGVISIRGDVKRVYDCDRENCETADRLTTSVEGPRVQKGLGRAPPPSAR
jgi:hypothetical protein